MTYISGLNNVLAIKEKYPNFKTILHSDQRSVYTSKTFNKQFTALNIICSMSRVALTDNGTMKAINGGIKAELFTVFHSTEKSNVADEIEEYIRFFNE